jgi:dienelactone hydrolase
MSRTNFAAIPHRLSLTTLLMLAFSGAMSRADDPRKSDEGQKETFTVDGKTITAERFSPQEKGNYPVVIVLPAVDGINAEFGPVYRQHARAFAAKGYEILLVDYLAATDTEKMPLNKVQDRVRAFYQAGAKPTEGELAFLKTQYQAWTRAARAAVKHAKPAGKRIGIVGFSLGGVVALGAAGDDDGSVTAVVNLFGGMPKEICKGIKKMPPSLHLHGDVDEIIPPPIAYQQEEMLRKVSGAVEFKMYQRMGHLEGGSLWDKLDVQKRVEQFLKKYLNEDRLADGK